MTRAVSFAGRWTLSALALAALAGCNTGRELVGRWVAVDATKAPANMVRITVANDHQLTLDNGDTIEYSEDPKKHTITVSFPDGRTYTYGFTRSGENMTLVDAGKSIKYMLDQQ